MMAYPGNQVSKDTGVRWVRKDRKASWDYQEAGVNQVNQDLVGYLDSRDHAVIMGPRERQASVDSRVHEEWMDHQE